MRWAGIDEAGYGPNLGPLVMTAVVAEGPADRPPDVWADLAATVCRADGPKSKLWIDDSKRVRANGRGMERLEAATLAALGSCGLTPLTLEGLLAAVGAGNPESLGLDRWTGGGPGATLPRPSTRPLLASWASTPPLSGATWRVVAVRSAVVDAPAFNDRLDRLGSKADAHFDVFAGLLRGLVAAGGDLSLRSDKHGGRHYYQGPLARALPGSGVMRIEESPARSAYLIEAPCGRVDLDFIPRADASDGLVALASIVSKAIRELWMESFNAFWCARVPGLKPTAGYPQDAKRFRLAIEPEAARLDWPPHLWWRAR